jgi:hypothetical protein
MPDDKDKRGIPDNKRIDINDSAEIRNWCKSFGCTEKELINAVRKVGTSASKVREYLKKK